MVIILTRAVLKPYFFDKKARCNVVKGAKRTFFPFGDYYLNNFINLFCCWIKCIKFAIYYAYKVHNVAFVIDLINIITNLQK